MGIIVRILSLDGRLRNALMFRVCLKIAQNFEMWIVGEPYETALSQWDHVAKLSTSMLPQPETPRRDQ